jgi:hypothetical protein
VLDVAKTTIPWVAIPADNVTACCSAIPVKARFGKASIIDFKELPEALQIVIPTIFRFFIINLLSLAKRLYFGGFLRSFFLWISPVLASGPGAWYFAVFFGLFNPLPFVVIM